MSSKVQKASPIGEDGIVRCYTHNVQAPYRVSTTGANPNRPYYCCYKDRDDKDRCKFFLWADDPIFQKQAPPPATPIANPSTPRPSQRQRADQARSPTPASKTTQLATPSTPLTPSQKRLAQIQAVCSPSPGKEERLANIRAGLAQSPTTSTSQLQPLVFPTGSPVQSGLPQSHSQAQSTPPPKSYSTPTQKAKAPSRTIPSPSPSHDSGEDVFSTPLASQGSSVQETVQYRLPDVLPPTDELDNRITKRPKLSHPSGDDIDSGRREVTKRSIGLPTPPRTSYFTAPTKGKGKERDMSNGGEPLTQWQTIGRDEDDPFHRGSTSNQTPQTYPNPATVVTDSDSLLTSLEETISSLRLHVEKVERKQVAAVKSGEAKSKRIEHLEAHGREKDNEIQELKTKVRVLEQTLKMRPV